MELNLILLVKGAREDEAVSAGRLADQRDPPIAGPWSAICPAYPLEDIHDPTGAGDAFAGGLAGYLAKEGDELNFAGLRCAVVHGSVLASVVSRNYMT